MEDIRKEEVVIVSIVRKDGTISSVKVYSLSLEQTTNKFGNISYNHTKDGCRHNIKSNLS